MAAKQQQAKKGCSKMGRNKEYSAVRKLTGRDSINKAEKIAKHNKEQANHALAKEAKHVVSRGAARDYRRNIAAYLPANTQPAYATPRTAMQQALLTAVVKK